ncbi:MAG TPA: DUF2795 domain-containing protein [Deltaproteobacteria bacterium]|nr:DUF2795 domain-containing protein [Deltaproteobacteria bacterium]HOI06695.1 DUF2795 domain-containing protein [Deltaproteobacteria bacterium]
MAGSGDVSTVDVEMFLKGMSFPSDKDGLIRKARENGAPDDVMDLLNNLPDRDHHTPIDASRAAGGLKQAAGRAGTR